MYEEQKKRSSPTYHDVCKNCNERESVIKCEECHCDFCYLCDNLLHVNTAFNTHHRQYIKQNGKSSSDDRLMKVVFVRPDEVVEVRDNDNMEITTKAYFSPPVYKPAQSTVLFKNKKPRDLLKREKGFKTEFPVSEIPKTFDEWMHPRKKITREVVIAQRKEASSKFARIHKLPTRPATAPK